MATEKRARQRANRAEKQAHEAKRRRRDQAWALFKKWGLYAVLIVAAFVLISIVT